MKHVLVIRLSALGDVALMAPLVHDYAVANPGIRFTVAGPPLLQPLFTGMDNVEYLGMKKKQSFIKIYKVLNAVGADTVVDLHKVNRVGFALTLLRLRHLFNFHFRLCALRKGKLTRWLYLHHLYHHPRKPQYQRYDEVFQRAGLRLTPGTSPVSTPLSTWRTPQGELSTAGINSFQRRGVGGEAAIGIAPFSQHQGKIWPWENTCRLVSMLADSGYRVLLFGSKEEAPQLETLENTFNSSPETGEGDHRNAVVEGYVKSLAGKQSFAEELDIIKNLSLMVSMDSSNMHFASVLGVPVVSIWGATHPDFGFYPQRQSRDNALVANLPCQPCSAFGQKACRYGDYRCLAAITPEMVFEKVSGLLSDNVAK